MAVPKKWVAVTGHASNALPDGIADGLYANVAGDIAIRFDDAAADTTVTVPAGGYVLGRVAYVRATGTTATGIFALYN